mmetsp:Transcript_42221/g.133016  ORF Transcript_42221/g.133016 Transcript_42221/m.133016 type:complete len:193 (+) Transcript_42221:386-964(+)
MATFTKPFLFFKYNTSFSSCVPSKTSSIPPTMRPRLSPLANFFSTLFLLHGIIPFRDISVDRTGMLNMASLIPPKNSLFLSSGNQMSKRPGGGSQPSMEVASITAKQGEPVEQPAMWMPTEDVVFVTCHRRLLQQLERLHISHKVHQRLPETILLEPWGVHFRQGTQDHQRGDEKNAPCNAVRAIEVQGRNQ